MGLKSDMTDELDGPPIALVLIPRSSLASLAIVPLVSLLFGCVALLVAANLQLGPDAAHTSARLVFDVVLFAIVLFVVPVLGLAWARRPELEVGKEGIRLPVARRPAASSGSPWNVRDLGLFTWDEVSNCPRWSPSALGVLQVQVKATRARGAESSTRQPGTNTVSASRTGPVSRTRCGPWESGRK